MTTPNISIQGIQMAPNVAAPPTHATATTLPFTTETDVPGYSFTPIVQNNAAIAGPKNQNMTNMKRNASNMTHSTSTGVALLHVITSGGGLFLFCGISILFRLDCH